MKKGEKYHNYGTLSSLETYRLPFRRQEKIRNNRCLNIRCTLSLQHCFNVTPLKINLAAFLQEEALNDNVMKNYMLINLGY